MKPRVAALLLFTAIMLLLGLLDNLNVQASPAFQSGACGTNGKGQRQVGACNSLGRNDNLRPAGTGTCYRQPLSGWAGEPCYFSYKKYLCNFEGDRGMNQGWYVCGPQKPFAAPEYCGPWYVTCGTQPEPTDEPTRPPRRDEQEQSYTVLVYSDSDPARGPIQGVSIAFKWNNEGTIYQNTGSDGKTNVSRDDDEGTENTLTITPGQVTIDGMPYRFDAVADIPGCTAPAGLSVNGGVISITREDDQDECIPLRYTRQVSDQSFGIAIRAYYRGTNGQPVWINGLPVTFTWNRGDGSQVSQNAATNASGQASASRTFSNQFFTRMEVAPASQFLQNGSRQFQFSGWTSTAGCVLPADWGRWNTGIPRATSPEYYSQRSDCLAAEYIEIGEPFTASAFTYYRSASGAVQPLAGVPVSLTWERGDGHDIPVSMTTAANGLASNSQTLRTSITTAMRYGFPASVSLGPGRQANLRGLNFASGAACSQPPDWSSWTTSAGSALSPNYSAGTSRCVAAEYEEVPQNFTARVHACYQDLSSGQLRSLDGVQVQLDWLRGGSPTPPAVTARTGMIPQALSRQFLPFTTTQARVVFPTEVTIGGNAFVFRGFQAGCGGGLSSGLSIAGPAATSPAATLASTWDFTARYEMIPLPVVSVDPLSPGSYYWKARDLCTPDQPDCKPLPFVRGTIANAYLPGTPPGTQTSFATITLIAPTGHPFFVYQVPVIATTPGLGGYLDGRFALDEGAVKAIEQSVAGRILSACTLFPDRLCFGTTVGQPGSFRAGATREDQAIGIWRFEITFTRTDPDGTARTSPPINPPLTYTVVWHMQAAP